MVYGACMRQIHIDKHAKCMTCSDAKGVMKWDGVDKNNLTCYSVVDIFSASEQFRDCVGSFFFPMDRWP